METLYADLQFGPLLSTVVYSIVGIVMFLLAFFIMDKLTPFSIRKEIEQDQNTALGIIMGSVFIALALIISSAISG